MSILTTYTLKYLRLNRKRTAVTILGVILSAALICGVFLLGVSFQKVMIEHEIFMAGNWHYPDCRSARRPGSERGY